MQKAWLSDETILGCRVHLDSNVGIEQSFLRVPELSSDIIVVHAEAEMQNRWSGVLVLMIFQSRCNVDLLVQIFFFLIYWWKITYPWVPVEGCDFCANYVNHAGHATSAIVLVLSCLATDFVGNILHEMFSLFWNMMKVKDEREAKQMLLGLPNTLLVCYNMWKI